ncbi:MAG: SusC/RagA family TonB-linked outer membrane protein [Muribaculaceae bacterium]|nr:SusC/RagA family TonB-linked outer membrane protein [Muribaculaceae bacterium]
MKKQFSLLVALSLACGAPSILVDSPVGFTAVAQTMKATGVITDASGEPLIGATVMLKGTKRGVTTDVNGHFSIDAPNGSTLIVSYVGMVTREIKVGGKPVNVTLEGGNALDEVVVTALGIKREKKSLGYAVDDINAEELMKNKNTNAINSLAGKIAGVSITQSSGSAGAGSQIILRGGTSLERDNQPLFVVDGVIYDNSTSSIGNSAYDGMLANATSNSNRIMDVNPEDIENMSVLKGPAAAALYGSRAAAGVVLITTKQGKEGAVEVNLNAKYTTSWVHKLPEQQKTYARGYYTSDENGNAVLQDYTTQSWGAKISETGGQWYDNVGNFFENSGAWDTNLSIAGGNKNGKFFLSGSFYDQDGIIPTTGFTKTTFRFNGEQKWKMLTFGANVAYSQSRTDKTLTSAGLYGSSGNGSMTALYNFAGSDDMRHYLNEDGSKYRMFADRQNLEDDIENPYWMLDNYKMKDNTERFTGNFSVKADIFDWWWLSYRMGIDSYTTENSNRIGEGAAVKALWQNGMLSENSLRYQYLSTNLISNMNKQFGDFNVNLMLGTSTDYTKSTTNYRWGWGFEIPGFYSFGNIKDANKKFAQAHSRKRLLGVFGEVRADWKNTVFLTVTGRNDWSSTLPVENRSYFYPSVSGAIAFTELIQDRPEWLSFGKIRASWARVGKDASPYATSTYLNSVATMLGDMTGYGTSWTRGNPILKPETTESTEVGLEMRFFNNRLHFDYAFYTNNTYDQIISPRGPQSTGYIFCSQNMGDVYNKGMELTIGGTPVKTRDFSWESSINVYGNRGTVKHLPDGTKYLYVTDVQVGNVQAASYNDGPFMALSGGEWLRNENGDLVLDKNFMPQGAQSNSTQILVGNREPKFQGGWNNTLTYKGFTFNMLWEFRVGGAVFNGTEYAMTMSGMSKLTEGRDRLEITGVQASGDGYTPVETHVFEADGVYNFNGTKISGKELIKNYYTSYYYRESRNFITDVNSLRLRTISLSYELPNNVLAKTKCIKRASVSATANNLLLFSNYHGDPEVAVSGSGITGSSSVGIDYCGVPSTASFSFGVNLTF